ncbi:MAG: protein kinase [Bacteroidetes bacterium]|nr:protein kinase [Bacteroidota bacterium]
MFTDIVGFTFLMGKNESQALSFLQINRDIHRECLHAHNGILVKEIGDGTLSWFSSAVDAVNCAMAIQQGLQQQDFHLRIGIHLGDVVFSDGDVYGNAVNIANRVEALANAGAVFVTEQVVESTRGIEGISFIFLGEKSLKNVDPLIRIFGLDHPKLTKPELHFFLENSIEQDIQQYNLLEKLGVGGMGVIYKALDTKLQRLVALKFLSSQLNQDDQAHDRLLLEARAAAALQHPNICTIYEIDETSQGRYFIAMEYLEGPTLKEKLDREGPLSSEQCLELSLQLAEGLQHAHQAGIVHRDIKPENIKINGDGVLKILDFGMALPSDLNMYKFGLRSGTLAYMSPEQASGNKVDQRADIWSFGVVMYQMLTGQLPFSAAYDHALVYEIVHEAHKPLALKSEIVPTGLEELIDTCLEKEVEFRSQTASDLVANLRRLQRDQSQQSSTVDKKPSLIKRLFLQLINAPWLLPLMLLVAMIIGWGLSRWIQKEDSTSITQGNSMELSPLNIMGDFSLNPAWSPDGESVIYVTNEHGSMDIWKKQLSGGKTEAFTKWPGNENEPAWSPDGENIVFHSDSSHGGLVIVPADGGTPYNLVNFGRSPAWSPDSRQLVFSATGSVFVLPSLNEEPIVLVEGTSSNPYPVWTADGQRILFWHRTLGDIHVVDAKGGNPQSLSLIPSGQQVSSLHLNQEGNRLLYSMGPFGGNKDLYEVLIDSTTSMPLAKSKHLTITTTDDVGGAYSPDGKHISFTARTVERHLYALPLDPATGLAAGDPKQLTRNGKLNYYPALSADGEMLVWTSHRSGQGNLYARALSDDQVEKVTSSWSPAIREIGACFGPDGKQVIFTSTQGGSYQLWRVPSVGSVGFSFTNTEHPIRDIHPHISPDGNSVVFYSNRSGTWDIWKHDSQEGNTPIQLTDQKSNELYPVWAPDGNTIAFVTNRDGNTDIWTMAADGTDARPYVTGPTEDVWCSWSPDQRWFYFVSDRGGNYNIWRIPAEGGEAVPVTNFNDPAFGLSESSLFTKFAVGHDQLILPLESRKGDLYLLKLND